MNENAEFIAYCLEEYKAATGMTGKEVITLLKNTTLLIILFPATELCIRWVVLPLQKTFNR